ncbi:MAG: hypothetical protein K2Q18_05240 [Bdellovibrionales bacterium]|nr:hypothetical protein [Bdellovibrionales bacterium]
MKKLAIGTLVLVFVTSAFAGNEIKCTYSRLNSHNEVETKTYDLNENESVIQYFGTSRLNVTKGDNNYSVMLEAIGTETSSTEYGPIGMFMIDSSQGPVGEKVFLDLEYASKGIPEQKILCTTKYNLLFSR